MYSILIFIRKTENEIMDNLRVKIEEFINAMFGMKISFAKIEGSAMLEEKYIYFSEVKLESKEEVNKKLQSSTGKEFSKFLGETGNLITVYFADYKGN